MTPEHIDEQEYTEIWSNMCRIRSFEDCVYTAIENGHITTYAYLSAGHEAIPSTIAPPMRGAWSLSQHRNHGNYIAFGGDLPSLRDELLGLPTGCCGGMGGSPPIQDREKKIIGHCGLIADHIGIATGIAYARREPVVCFFGDGAAEEDYALPPMGFAATHNLPILFVCEDNDLSVLTEKHVRRCWNIVDVAKSLGIKFARDIIDNPLHIREATMRAKDNLPALLNIRVCRKYWHVGAGSDGDPSWDRMNLVREDVVRTIGASAMEKIEADADEEMNILWNGYV
jgi:acetoin:2,6-dichlorophenolindophenol oxidoreductase subunit alpha